MYCLIDDVHGQYWTTCTVHVEIKHLVHLSLQEHMYMYTHYYNVHVDRS